MKPIPPIDITSEEMAIVQSILLRLIPNYKVGVFGSRVTGKARKYSDLDLVVMTEKPLDFDVYSSLKEAFSESTLPFKVDIVDWAATEDNFKKIIEQQRVFIQ